MDKEAYIYPTSKIYDCVSAQVIATSPLTGSTENFWSNSPFENPSEDNGGDDMGWN